MTTTQQTHVDQDGHSWIIHPTDMEMVKTCETDFEFLICNCEH